MPTYQYACTACGEQHEAVQSFTDAPLTDCPACGGRLRKVFSAVGVVFKGSGFYKTDSRSGSGAAKGDGKADSGKSDGGKTDGGGSKDGGSSTPTTPSAAPAAASGAGSSSGSSTPAAKTA